MGKQGPCCHCGVTSTPLWRNGPPEKPVLCNACGSRWRTKGSLTNYIPLHAREVIGSNELNGAKKRSITFKLKQQKLPKTTQHKHKCKLQNECDIQYCDQNFCKFEGDSSNRSCSRSAISGSGSCLYFGTDDASNLTGSVQSNVCDSLVPSKKTFVTHPKLSVEKLTKELYSIWHEQQASNLSRTSEDELLYSSITPFGSFEIGYGSVLIKNINSKTIDEESEASSFPVDKSFFTNEAYSDSAFLPIDTKTKGIVTSGANTLNSTIQMVHVNAKRVKVTCNKFASLKDRDSPLIYTDLNFFINCEGFMKYFTHEEQQQLMKYLPPMDITKTPESLNSMFTSPQFLAALSCFQQLLQEGVLDLSLAGANAEECKILRRLLLQSSDNRWLECYQKIRDAPLKKMNGGKDTLITQKLPGLSNLASTKRKHDKQNQNHSDLTRTMKSPKRVYRPGGMNPPSKCSTLLDSSIVNPVTGESEKSADNDAACSSPKTVYSGLSDKSNTMQSFMQFIADSSEGDLFLDFPTSTSFSEAELYHPWKKKPNPNGLPDASVVDILDIPTSSFSNKV